MIRMHCFGESLHRRAMANALLCANLAIRCGKPSYTELSNGCSQEVQ
jgi:hypothetical protein